MSENNPNCIIKAFENNNINILQECEENKQIFLFRGNDVANVLDITNIRSSIQNYTDKEKVVRAVYDVRGCEQNTIFLTSRGVYRLLFASKKKVAEQFRDWVGDIMDDIIFNQSKKLKEQLDEKNFIINEKNKIINTLQTKVDDIMYLYIGHNKLINNQHKIGITSNVQSREENHKSSNINFEYIFTYETKNSKEIETLIKLYLKPFKQTKPEWFNISYAQMKKVTDFCIMIYDNYKISENLDNLIEFCNRYRDNRLINSSLSRVIINKNIYEDYIKDNLDFHPKAKVSCNMLCDNFYNWYINKYPKQYEYTHIKTISNKWSTFFQQELLKNLTEITKIKTKSVTIVNAGKNLKISNNTGFVGFEIKEDIKNNYYDEIIYKSYIDNMLIITHNPRHKISRLELADDFSMWVKNHSDFKYNNNTYNQTFTNYFKIELIKNIEKFTNIKFNNKLGKKLDNGIFIGINHPIIDCLMIDTITPKQERVKKYEITCSNCKNIGHNKKSCRVVNI